MEKMNSLLSFKRKLLPFLILSINLFSTPEILAIFDNNRYQLSHFPFVWRRRRFVVGLHIVLEIKLRLEYVNC